MKVTFDELKRYVNDVWKAAGASDADSEVMADIFTETTKRGVGHHDIHNFPSRIDRVESGMINPTPKITKIAAFGAMESWDGDHGTGEVLNRFIMQRAIDLAETHGIAMVTVRNSNHYLCSAPFVEQAAKQGYIGFIMAKAGTAMGMPGMKGTIIGQSPIGYAFPTDSKWPVMMDICLAYIAGEPLMIRAKNHESIPAHWGADKDGNPTTSAEAVVNGGVKFPIGEHKGFGLALLEELLTGVLSSGAILDDGEEDPIYKGTSHTAIAIKADALMDMETYKKRSHELIERLKNRSDKVRIPGDRSWEKTREYNAAGYLELDDDFVTLLNTYAERYHVDPLHV